MTEVRLNSFKVSTRLDLEKVADFFKLRKSIRWNQYVILEDHHLDMIFKYSTQGKQAYLFQFGCITLVNFSGDEIRHFLEYVEAITGNIDYDMFIKYYETHTIEVLEDGTCLLWKSHDERLPYGQAVIDAAAIVLAKSAALYRIETDASKLLDEAEKFIYYLRKGKLSSNSKSFASVVSKLLRFEFDSINDIRIFDRSGIDSDSSIERETYDNLSGHYELHERFDILENKIEELLHIIKSYSTLSFKNAENRRNLFLVFLLSLFPLSYVLEHLVGKFKVIHAFEMLFR